MPNFYSTRETAELLGTALWRVRRLFECGALSEPQRIAGRRIIPRELLPVVAGALVERGWLGSAVAETEAQRDAK